MEFSFSVALIFVGKMCATLSEPACKKLENKLKIKLKKNHFSVSEREGWILHGLYGLIITQLRFTRVAK